MDNMITNRDDEIVIDLMDLINFLLSKIWIIAVSTVVAGILGLVISAGFITPVYESTTSIYILNKSNDDSMTYSDTQLATQLTKDYEKLITRRYVLEQVIEDQGLAMTYGALAKNVTVSNVTNTRIIEISVRNSDPKVAQKVADSIREVAADYIKEVTAVEAVNVVDVANLPTSPVEPSVAKWTVMGLALGMIASAGVLVVLYLMDDTIKSADDVSRYLGLGTLAMIPDTSVTEKTKKKKKKTTGLLPAKMTNKTGKEIPDVSEL